MMTKKEKILAMPMLLNAPKKKHVFYK